MATSCARTVGMRGGRAGERAPPALPLLLALLLALAAPGPRPAAGFAVHACKKKSVRAPPSSLLLDLADLVGQLRRWPGPPGCHRPPPPPTGPPARP